MGDFNPSSSAISPDRIEFRTLGAIDLRHAQGPPIPALLAQPKRLGLLAYLALASPREFHRRDTLLGLFWPDVSQDRARNALNKAIYFLRQSIGKDTVISRGTEEIGLARDRIWCDAVAFEDAIEAGRLEEAASLYRGPLLQGLFVSDAMELDLWLEAERERLARRHAEILEILAGCAARRGDPAAAAGWWRQAIEEDPYASGPVLGLMQALAASGNRGEAIHEAERHARRLRDELDAEPDSVIVALAGRLREMPTEPVQDPLPEYMTPRAASQFPPFRDAIRVRGAESGSATRARSRIISRAAAVALTSMALLAIAMAVRRGTPELQPGEATAGTTTPLIAVLPFATESPELDFYREGMVDILSVHLAGVEVLRPVEVGRILAAWNNQDIGTISGSDRSILVARWLGADYAVDGRAVRVGERVALIAQIHDVKTGRQIGGAKQQGSPDSLFALADRLSLEIVRLVLDQNDIEVSRLPKLAALTTSSLPALKDYLEGERAFRASDFPSAIEAYERAVRADSTFALAIYRLKLVSDWASSTTAGHLERVIPFVDRLPFREASIVRAYVAWDAGSPDVGLSLVQRAAQIYPDAAEAWYVMGELYAHFGGQLLAKPGADEHAFARAIALDPGTAPYHWHYIERAFNDADSAAAALRIEAFARIAEDQVFERANQLAFALAFGDPAGRAKARIEIPSISTETLARASRLLYHPRFLETREELLGIIFSRPDFTRSSTEDLDLFETLRAQGQFGAARKLLEDGSISPGIRAYGAHSLSLAGAPLPARWVEGALAFSPEDSMGWLYAGAHALDRGRLSDWAAARHAARQGAQRRGAAGDSVGERSMYGVATALEGYRLWKTGKAQEAVPVLELAQRRVRGWIAIHYWNMTIRWWLGLLLAELDRPAEAARYFDSVWYDQEDPFAAFEAGRVYVLLGEREKAARAFRYALEAWPRADPEVAPRITAARAALVHLDQRPSPPRRSVPAR